MKNALLLLTIILFQQLHAQPFTGQMEMNKVPTPLQHAYEEYTFDTTVNPAAWKSLQKGVHVSFATTDELYFRSEVPVLNKTSLWNETGWKGERLSTQILVWSADTTMQVRVMTSDLKSAKGKTIAKENIKVQLVRYVVSNYPYGSKDATCGTSTYNNIYLMPDRFEPFTRFDLPGKSLRPVWLSIDIPATAEADVYSGKIEVSSLNTSTKLDVKINVQNQLLPKPHDWKYRLDLWQNPWVVAWRNNLKPWSEEHKTLLKQHLKLYADAGGKYITTYAVHSPWADNSYMIEGGMIEWIKRKDNTWKFDYSIFDTYVQLAMSVGIDKAITIYTPVPWGFRFRYLDEKTGNYEYVSYAPSSKEFKTFFSVFLTDLQKHLVQKGWFDKTYLGINENAMEETLAAIDVVKQHSKKWKITYAGDWHPELDALLDDYCFVYGKETSVDSVKQRSARKQTTTFYVCCTPPYPNDFLFSPPVEGTWLSWYASAHGYDGFLRWAYDAWVADPARDARHPFWPAGDCFLVYPGGNSGIRFEKLREGIVDFEKIRILREKAMKSGDEQVRTLWNQLNDHLKAFLSEKDFDTKKITDDMNKGRMLVDQLSDALSGTMGVAMKK